MLAGEILELDWEYWCINWPSIEATHNGDVEKCLPKVIETWLRRAFGEVHDGIQPTWSSLCAALSFIDRSLAESLAEEHDSGDVRMQGLL